jgi:ubiquinol-cytochrome c reductase cytochrome b subunit
MLLLHSTELGSSNPLSHSTKESIKFNPYYFVKDIIGFVILSIASFFLIFFSPNLLGHDDNYVSANPLITPEHIVPEWYFLAIYAILRSIPNKVLGISVISFLFIILAFLPFTKIYRRSKFLYLINILSGLFVSLFITYSFLGGSLVQEPFVSMTRYLLYPGLLLYKDRFINFEQAT